MPKNKNGVESTTIRVTVSVQSENLLEQLVQRGVYGRSIAEVAGRFIDRALQDFTSKPILKVALSAKPRKERGNKES
jgi:hypothetical protein